MTIGMAEALKSKDNNPQKAREGRLQSTVAFWLIKVNPTLECNYIQKK